jgi:hypothetical protein
VQGAVQVQGGVPHRQRRRHDVINTAVDDLDDRATAGGDECGQRALALAGRAQCEGVAIEDTRSRRCCRGGAVYRRAALRGRLEAVRIGVGATGVGVGAQALR